MAKRTAFEADSKTGHETRNLKRQRVENPEEHKPDASISTPEQVVSARQLQNALVFDQGAAAGFRSGLFLLKSFLDSIQYSDDKDDLPRKRAILREYLESQKKKEPEDRDVTLVPNLIQAWDYAAETNFDALLSQVTGVLALLVKVLASDSQFLELGNILCKTILQPSVARRLNRSLSAAPSKGNVISPALRLLTEITNFNEGSHAKAVYAKRDFTLEPKILTRNLELGKDRAEDKAVDQRKPSIRMQAIKYLLSHIRHQDEIAKIEILSNYSIVKVLFEHLHADPAYLIVEVFNVLKHHVFLDKTIPRQAKSRILSGKILSHIATVYRYHIPEESLSEGHKSPDVAAHEFLMMVCTSPALGVVLPSHGFYPHLREGEDMDVVMEDAADFGTDLYLDSTDVMTGHVRVRNSVLSDFLQTLRPYAHTLQQELVLAIFKASPELVADYFIRKEAFNYDPNLTSTWIGYSALLYQTIELPVPKFLGQKRGYSNIPPPTSVVIQSILPQPLTQDDLTKCLNHNSELISFFAIRVLIVAFHKLRSVLNEFKKASLTKSKLWEQATQRLISQFCQRCPTMKSVRLALSRTHATMKPMKREAFTRMVRLYFEILPQVALEEKFDVTILLCNALAEADKPADSSEDKALHILEVEHWVKIARHYPAMRWWQKHKTLQYSPFMMLLKLVATSTAGHSHAGIKSLLISILRDHDMLQMVTKPTALDALLASLHESCESSRPSPLVLEFVDDCCARYVKAPIKYADELDKLRAEKASDDHVYGSITPLLMTLVEQWPFKGGSASKDGPGEPIAHWLSKFLFLLKWVGEDVILLEGARDSLLSVADKAYQDILKDSFLWKMGKEKAKEALKAVSDAQPAEEPQLADATNAPTRSRDVMTADLELPPSEDKKHTGLNRWRNHELEENIEDGNIGDLLLCLSSEHREIRLQAVTNIKKLMASIENSEFLQLKLLLGEAVETARPVVDESPLPYVASVFAARAVSIVVDPTHFMFGKVNKLLIKRPSWTVENLPRYFAANIIRNEPEQNDSYHKEVEWLVDYLIDCLRTTEDMEIFRNRSIFERVLTYYASSVCSISSKEKIVRLLFRGAAVGGSTTLITRCAVLSWIQMRLAQRDHRAPMLRQLAARLYETCDKERVEEWSNGKAKESIAVLESVATQA
ncbi:hypothetical protein GQ43DRAFT_479245 [Delitschia confertaspora ATCC 74209]|uniref:Ribosome biogenesis protein Urb1 n=1 Tax=Delitschia confertaspora ATCC 74209 TaxID=1513339 RepID=A0A9P4MUL6_9PLEO|nr:hypothetical protein GQ43DRAFT_479245 [Delitschia confertaspora ATCC 74209]